MIPVFVMKLLELEHTLRKGNKWNWNSFPKALFSVCCVTLRDN